MLLCSYKVCPHYFLVEETQGHLTNPCHNSQVCSSHSCILGQIWANIFIWSKYRDCEKNENETKEVEQTIIIKENKSKVDDFKRKTTYEIVETGENAFRHVDIYEILRETESDNEDNLFDTDDNNSSIEEYDTDPSDEEEESEMEELSDDDDV